MGITERHWFEDEEPELTERQLEDIVYENKKAYDNGYAKGLHDAKTLEEYNPESKTVFVVSYYKHGEAPIVTVYNNEDSASRHYRWALMIGGYEKVDMDECPVYQSFTINRK